MDVYQPNKIPMSPVRAKFVVVSLTKQTMWNGSTNEIGTTIKMIPVMNDSEENKQFYRYTPGGLVELGTVNADTAKVFEIGKQYYLDFTPA